MIKSEHPKNQSPAAVLIGLDSLQGLQAARILARRGVPVIALARDPHHYGCRTNVCQQIIHTDTESEQMIRTLEKLGPTLAQKAVLFPCEDANVQLVSRHRARLTQWYHIALPAPETVEMLLDKASFYRFAAENGFPVPRSFHVYNRAEVEQAARELTFPCILKPPMSATPEWEHNTFLKAFKVGDAAELLALYDRFRRWSPSFVVQEWIDGPEINHYTCNGYFSANGEPLVTFTTQKIRQWPPRTGQACLGVECHNEAVRAETVRLFERLNFHGLAYLEMKQDSRTGRYLIIEPNIGRPTGRSATAEAGGVELLYTMYCEALGWPLPTNRQQRYTGVKWIYLRQDFQAALLHWRQGNLSLQEWWRSWQGRKTEAVFSWRDPVPFIADGLRVARVALSAAERQKRNYAKPLLETR